MIWQAHDILLYILSVSLGGLALYKLFAPTYPWEVVSTEQYLTELVKNVTKGILNTSQSEIPIPDIDLHYAELNTTFRAESGSVFDMSTLQSVNYRVVSKDARSKVIELYTNLKTFQVVFQQYKAKVNNIACKGKISVSVGKNSIKTTIDCIFVKSCVCETSVGPTIIEDIDDYSVTMRGAESNPEISREITDIKYWVINHVVINVKRTIEMSLEESSKRFTVTRYLKCD